MMTPPPPWRIDYFDGNGNGYRFERGSDAEVAEARFDPVDPATSSSGTYDGGEPWASDLDEAEVAELWRWVEGLTADTSLHLERRTKGTGMVRVSLAGEERAFVLAGGARRAAFETFLPSLK